MSNLILSIEGFKDYLVKQPLKLSTIEDYCNKLNDLLSKKITIGISSLDDLFTQLNQNILLTEGVIGRIYSAIDKAEDCGITSKSWGNIGSAINALGRYLEFVEAKCLASEIEQEYEEPLEDSEDTPCDDAKEEISPTVSISVPSTTTSIKWYDIRKKYKDPFIYNSMKESIKGNFLRRLTSQSRPTTVPFPIKSLFSLFKTHKNHLSVTNQAKLPFILDNAFDRILFYVAASSKRESLRLHDGVWAYSLKTIEYLGVDGNGQIYIRLYNDNTALPVLTFGKRNGSKQNQWHPMTGVTALRQINLDHDPLAVEIIYRLNAYNGLPTLTQFGIMCAQNAIDIFTVGQIKSANVQIQSWITANLDKLFEETERVLSLYNLDAMLEIDNKGKSDKFL